MILDSYSDIFYYHPVAHTSTIARVINLQNDSYNNLKVGFYTYLL